MCLCLRKGVVITKMSKQHTAAGNESDCHKKKEPQAAIFSC